MKHLELRRRPLITREGEELDSSDTLDHRPSFSKYESDLLRKEEEPVGILSVALIAVATFSYTMDVASSAVGCFWLYNLGRWWWWMTIGPLLAALCIVNAFSIRWYIHDAQESKEHLPPVSAGHWVLRVAFHLMLLGPVIRYFELFLYGVHTVDKKDPDRHQYRLMFLQEERDVTLLALVGSFVKSAPILVLQMYILTQNKIPIDLTTTRSQALNLVVSLFELSLTQSSYRRALRRASPFKHNMTKLGTTVQLLSHCLVIASRVLALASFATAYGHWIFTFVGIHWCLMTTWLVFLRTSFCATTSGTPRPLEELVFNVVLGVIYVFCFVNVKDEPTRWKYTIYYIIIGIENLVLVVLWYLKTDQDLWFRIPLLVSVIASLVLGLVFLALYYQYLHPNKVWKKQLQNDQI